MKVSSINLPACRKHLGCITQALTPGWALLTPLPGTDLGSVMASRSYAGRKRHLSGSRPSGSERRESMGRVVLVFLLTGRGRGSDCRPPVGGRTWWTWTAPDKRMKVDGGIMIWCIKYGRIKCLVLSISLLLRLYLRTYLASQGLDPVSSSIVRREGVSHIICN
jgi:hypothetical protein